MNPVGPDYFKPSGGSHTRLEIAQCLLGAQRTQTECARWLGMKAAGSIAGALERMVEDGVIARDGEGRGALYTTSSELTDVLEVATSEYEPVGRIQDGQVLVVVTAPDQATLHGALQHRSLTSITAWVARMADEPAGALLAISGKASAAARSRLLAALPRAGVTCHALQVTTVLSATAYRRESESVCDAISDVERSSRGRE